MGEEKHSVDVSSILTEGTFHILDDYALKDTFYPTVVDTFLEGVEKFEGTECRKKVEADGLSQLHKHFPVEKIHLLEAFLLQRLRDDLYYWSYRVGHEDLGLDHPFFVDDLIVFRVHYPYLVARQAKNVLAPPLALSEKLRIAKACLKNWGMISNHARKWWQARGENGKKRTQYDAIAYHGNLPRPARAHGPHIDTWYGHSYDGVNLWWSIDGVNLDNTVILYPDMFGQRTDYDPVSMYLASGIPVSRPHKVAIQPNQLLLFNSETLHGTQVNISDETRVVITTRINPGTPRFTPNAPFHFEHWYASTDLERRKFSSLKVFASHKFQGKPTIAERPAFCNDKTVRKTLSKKLPSDDPVEVCASSELRTGDKMAVDLDKTELLLWRVGDKVRVYRRRCPHLGVDLVDGFHDDEQVFCPGHGIAFSLADGTSSCDAFKLRQFHAFEENGSIFVQRKAPDA